MASGTVSRGAGEAVCVGLSGVPLNWEGRGKKKWISLFVGLALRSARRIPACS